MTAETTAPHGSPRLVEAICAECGVVFAPRIRSGQNADRFCGSPCKSAYWDKRRTRKKTPAKVGAETGANGGGQPPEKNNQGRVTVTVPANPDADLDSAADVEVFGGTVALEGAEAEAVTRIAAEGVLPRDELQDTDMANAARFVREHGADIRWTPERGWLVWDGRRWLPDETGRVVALAKETARGVFNELVRAGSRQREAALYKWARLSQSAERIRAMLYLAQSDVAARFTEFDTDPFRLNVANGALDLRTGELRPHRREDLLCRIADIEFDAGADFKAWDNFLVRVMDKRSDLIAYLQRAVGYSLTGSTAGQCLFFCYGKGANGKTVFLETLHRLLGEYAQNASAELVMMRQKGGIPNDVARLAGARLVTINETADGQRLHEPLVKDMTGGDTMTARFLHREFFDFRPTHKLWIRGNHKPQIRGTDEGIWRRIHLVPFAVQIPEAERIPLDELMAILQNEAPGILAWAVRGCVEWMRTGLKPPEAVREAVKAYREEMDVLGQFIEECCVVGVRVQCRASQLYAEYRKWSEQTGVFPQSQKLFGMALVERGFEKGRDTPGRTIYLGIGVQADEGPKGPKGSEGLSKFSPLSRARIEENLKSGSVPSDPSEFEDSDMQKEVSR